MPNGTWIVGEMAEAPRADGFKWGFTALPAVKEGGDRYSYTWFEQCLDPGRQPSIRTLPKQFMRLPVQRRSRGHLCQGRAPSSPSWAWRITLEGDNKVLLFSIYDNGAKAAHGQLCRH